MTKYDVGIMIGLLLTGCGMYVTLNVPTFFTYEEINLLGLIVMYIGLFSMLINAWKALS